MGTGKCLCGAVEVRAVNVATKLHACHCDMCRKWAGSANLSVDCGTEVTFQGEEYVGIYQSSEWAERGFCKQCGTHLFYKLIEQGQYMLPVGLFDDDHSFDFAQQIFVDEKPDYYTFANHTVNLTGEEVIAQFSKE